MLGPARLRLAGPARRCLHAGSCCRQNDQGRSGLSGQNKEQVADEMINILRENIPNANQKLNRAPGKEALDRADTAFVPNMTKDEIKVTELPALDQLPDFVELGKEKEVSEVLHENYRQNHQYDIKLQWIDALEMEAQRYSTPRVDSNAQLYTHAPVPAKYHLLDEWKPKGGKFHEHEKLKLIPNQYKKSIQYYNRQNRLVGSYKDHLSLPVAMEGKEEDWRQTMVKNAAIALGRNAFMTLEEKQAVLKNLKTIDLEPVDLLGQYRPAQTPKAATGGAVQLDEVESDEEISAAPAKEAAPRFIAVADDDDDEYDEDAEDDLPRKM